MNQPAKEHRPALERQDTLALQTYILLAIQISNKVAGLRKGPGAWNAPTVDPFPLLWRRECIRERGPLQAPAPWLAPSVQEREEGDSRCGVLAPAATHQRPLNEIITLMCEH